MPKYYVFHYTAEGRLPQLRPDQAAQFKTALQDILAQNSDVTYNGTMYDPGTGVGICDWDAPSGLDVEEIMGTLGLPFDVVVPVQPLQI